MTEQHTSEWLAGVNAALGAVYVAMGETDEAHTVTEDAANLLRLTDDGDEESTPMLATPKPKPTGPCPSCGLRVVLTGDGRHPCSWCGAPLTAAVADA